VTKYTLFFPICHEWSQEFVRLLSKSLQKSLWFVLPCCILDRPIKRDLYLLTKCYHKFNTKLLQPFSNNYFSIKETILEKLWNNKGKRRNVVLMTHIGSHSLLLIPVKQFKAKQNNWRMKMSHQIINNINIYTT